MMLVVASCPVVLLFEFDIVNEFNMQIDPPQVLTSDRWSRHQQQPNLQV